MSGRRASLAPGSAAAAAAAMNNRRQSVAPWLLNQQNGNGAQLPTLESSLNGAVLGGDMVSRQSLVLHSTACPRKKTHMNIFFSLLFHLLDLFDFLLSV